MCLAIHKPRGYISERLKRVTKEDDGGALFDALGRPTVYNLIPEWATQQRHSMNETSNTSSPSSSFSSSSQAARKGAVSAIGRLDLETSGVLLFTSDAKLNLVVRGGGVEKTYVATVSGAGLTPERLAAAVRSIQTPLELGGGGDGGGKDDDADDDADGVTNATRGPVPSKTKAARARVLREWRLRPSRGTRGTDGDGATDAEKEKKKNENLENEEEEKDADDDDEDDDDEEEGGRGGVEDEKSKKPDTAVFLEHAAAEAHWRSHRRAALGVDETQELRLDGGDGVVVDVEIRVNEGKFHQVRRLVKRAGLRMRHLRRVGVGPLVTLKGIERPGECRRLTLEEVRSLMGAGTGGESDQGNLIRGI